jgi:hypothetical protein
MRHSLLDQIKHRKHIGPKCFFQLLGRDIHNAVLRVLHGCIVHKNIEPLKVRNCFLNYLSTEFLFANIPCEEKTGFPVFFHH